MAAQKFLRSVTVGLGRVTREVFGLQVSAGSASGGAIVALRDDGTLDPTMMPPGIGADTFVALASEALAAGAVVNIYSNAGAFAMRNADATIEGKEAWGYTTVAFASSAMATAYAAGNDTNVAGLTPGAVFMARTPGGVTQDVSGFTAGNVVQKIGVASSATSFNYQKSEPVTILS